ncbi:MAG: hypothetical protein L3J47_00305 [Sulfurovum sp.]|nr:hypothetical protein [Sulfurovum sp.]
MSSTNRGSKREDFDKYFTPEWLVGELPGILTNLEIAASARVLEPCVGGGAIYRGLINTFNGINCADIEPEDDFPCAKQDFLDFYPRDLYDLVVSNPPFNIAQKIIERAIDITRESGHVVMLLRINFFGGQKRSAWLSGNMPIECYVTPRRPKFKNGKSDSTEYAWFVWEVGKHPDFTKTFLLDTRTARYR